MCRKFFQKWYGALIKPKETFKKEKKNADYSEAVKHIGIAGLIFGIISFIFVNLGLYGSVNLNIINAGLSITAILLYSLLIFFINSGILYIFAKIFGGRGKYETQTYLFSLFKSPMLIIVNFLLATANIFGMSAIGSWIVIGLTAYSLYLATLALKETHAYHMERAVATWLAPAAIYILIIFAAYTYYFPLRII